MAEYAGNVARLHFESANLAPEVFQVSRLEGIEGISKPFRFEVSLISEDPDIAIGDVVNQRASLNIRRVEGEDRTIHGIVTRIGQANRVAEYVAYSVVLEPRLRLLSLSFQTRIFQHATVEEIVTEVLSDSGITGGDLKWDLKAHYDPREYVVQYRETDLDFISRLLEHEGIHYFFSHSDGYDTIIFSDGNHAHEMVGGETPEFMYNPGGSLIPDESRREFIHSFSVSERVVTGKFVLDDYNYRTPSTAIDVESNINSDMPGTKYEYGNHYADRGAGDRLAKVRNEEVECRRVKMSGKSNILHLECGYVFSQVKHFAGSLNQDYLVDEVRHTASQAQALGMIGGEETADIYTNEFTCIPASAPFRPERTTPVPQVSGITTGKIETGGGDYAYIDDHGRYRVKMYFDQSSETDGTATRPIRMSQPYAGPGYGIHFPLHAGAEVAVAHIDGNIDRPVLLGAVPNPNNTSPSIASNKAQSVIRTWGNNELTFDDTKDGENIYMHATKDHTVKIENDESISIGHDQSQSVDNDQTESIGNDQELSVGNDQKLSVGNDRSKEVGNDQSAKIGNDKTISVGNDHTESIGANMEIKIEKDLTEEVGKNYSETVGDDMEVDVGGSMTIKVGKDKTDEVGKKYSESVGTDSSTEIGGAKTEKVGKKSSLEVEANYSVKAKKISIVAADQIQLKTGKASITLLKSGDILIRGKKIVIKGSGDLIFKGKKIQHN